jgi:phosphate starvation-inducible protein PhoH
LSRAPEFINLSDAASRAVAGANSRHAALIEDAFDVLVETPGGGVSLTGDSKGRAQAKKAVQAIAERAGQAHPGRGLDPHRNDLADQAIRRDRVHRLQIGAAADQLARVAARALEQHGQDLADLIGVE